MTLSVQGEFIVFESLDGRSEVVAIDNCRPVNTATPLTKAHFKSFQIPVPDDLSKYFESPEPLADFVQTVRNVHVDYDKSNKVLNVSVSVRFSLIWFRVSPKRPSAEPRPSRTFSSMIPGKRWFCCNVRRRRSVFCSPMTGPRG